MTHKQIITEITALREQYSLHLKSWGKSDVDEWWETQLLSVLEKVKDDHKEDIAALIKQIQIRDKEIKEKDAVLEKQEKAIREETKGCPNKKCGFCHPNEVILC